MFMLEGEWSGYRSSQRHVVHREYISAATKSNRDLLEWLKATHAITYTDGTCLVLSVKEVDRRKEKPINGYGSLIRDCFLAKVTSVAALYPTDTQVLVSESP